MSLTKSYLRDLDDAISRGTAESRERALWHATDLLIAGSYSEEEVLTFGSVIGRLAEEIEVEVRAQLSERLARFDGAPANVIQQLAFDDAIEVAGPVLEESAQLDDDTLIANAWSKSQAHMLAISRRKSIGESVTDALVARGNRAVVSSLAGNGGANFSSPGLLHMVKRAEGDSILAEQLGLRKDIPRHLFQQLIAKATDDVRKRLERERPEMVGAIGASVVGVAGELQSKFGPVSRSYFVAKRVVTAQHRLGNLNEASIAGYARAHKLEEVTIGLSLLCALPVDVIERVLVNSDQQMFLVLAKALNFSWETTMALLFVAAKDHRITARDLNDLEREFSRLNAATSMSVLKFYQSRRDTDAAEPSAGHEARLAVN
ncbi:MAG TPA: DUF2336 domain-containing protein [Bradyrhizobium sp.]|uniref:DUF2336 domain-containing protein n=1 Tax=Bradyrhizobium sp. TaxID=376 RepID=UPI002BA6D18A|nr:DUF2336 domain-containing protein [Bradyrhizobium sp.]HLZ03817.1 DUF2336 domain-containing protein [Bradyrhizobium sp.]